MGARFVWCAVLAMLGLSACGGGTGSGEDAGPVQDGAVGMDGPAQARCGDGLLRSGEVCDDGNTIDGDGCSADCSSDERCGNGIRDTATGERCDDGNTADGDGCSAACDSDESCGNGVVDTAADEVCDDGNTADGDDCSADCRTSLRCGNGAVDGAEECDDGNTDNADGCSGRCLLERCGNGRVDAAEVCDDGNAVDGDGCTNGCTFTCSAAADCEDGDVCNGAEICASPGTTSSSCGGGAPPADGTSCGSGLICRAGACMAAACLDGVVSGSEECDDGNLVDTDGCTSLCRFTCSASSDCADANVCNGAETCTSPGTTASRCVAGTPPADGASCGTGRICRAGDCTTPGCGDGIVSGTEQCDDANTTNGDGCDNTCTWTCSVDADCSDGHVCNGAEVCTSGGTLLSRCGPGMPPSNGTSCGGSNLCVSGSCIAARCGDGLVSGTEQCDDANTTNADGCDNTCTWTCSVDADCSDGHVCNGAEVCTSGGTLLSRCGPGMPAPRGRPCGGAGTCSDGVCGATPCGASASRVRRPTPASPMACARRSRRAWTPPTSAGPRPRPPAARRASATARARARSMRQAPCAPRRPAAAARQPSEDVLGDGRLLARDVGLVCSLRLLRGRVVRDLLRRQRRLHGWPRLRRRCVQARTGRAVLGGLAVRGRLLRRRRVLQLDVHRALPACNSVVSTNEPGTCGTIECADPDNECPGTSFGDNAGRCSNICL